MSDISDDLKRWAKNLHAAVREGDTDSLCFVNHGAKEEVDLSAVRRRHVLAAIARHLGFRGWSHLTAVLGGVEGDAGTATVPPGSMGYTNVWCVDHAEAAVVRVRHDGFLLPYRRQFVVVSAEYVQDLGWSPDDPDWRIVGWDLARPGDVEAARRLWGRLLRRGIPPAPR